MSTTNRRSLMKSLGVLVPAAAAAGVQQTALAQAPAAAGGALDEGRVQNQIASLKPAVVLIEVETANGMSWGSGFFVSGDGLLVTNRHVIVGAQKITIIYRNKDRIPAQLVKEDRQYDLALVKVNSGGPYPTVTLGDVDQVREGTLVAVTGYPAPRDMVWLGMALDSSTSRGAVNGVRYGGDVRTLLGDRVLQIDAAVTHGNSGGPVTRLDTGEVIGVLTSGKSGAGNLTFAVPVNQVRVLIAGSGATVQARPIAPGSPDAALQAGDLRALNTISSSRDLPHLFCYGFTFQSNFKANEEPLADWEECIGSRPPDVTTLVRHGDDLFFGATDGKLRMQRLDRLGQEGPIVLLDAGPNFIMNSPPAVTEEVVVAAAGALDLRQKFVKRSASERLAIGGGAAVLGALLTRSPLGAIAGGILGSRGGNKEVLRIDGEGLLVGLNRRNNAVQWTIETGYAGNPVVHENRAFIGGMGERACIQLQDGREAWRTGVRKGNEAEFYHIGYAGSLGILGITVPVEPRKTDNGNIEILGDKEVRVEKYDPNTGAVVWKVEIGDVRKRRQVLGASLTVDEKKGILYAVAAQLVAAVDVNTGKLLWSYDHGKAMAELQKKSKDKLIQGVNFSPQIAVQDGVIYVGSEDRKLYAINAQDGKQLWVYNARGPVSHPVFQEGRIYVGSGDGQFHVVDARTGELAWRVRLGSPVISPPLLWEGLAFVATASGDLQTIRLPIA